MGEWNPQANELFLEALDRAAGPARIAFVDEACRGDEALKADVVSLLEASERDEFLSSPAEGIRPTYADATPGAAPGTVIGPYKLLQVIGEGGMGVVYMAEQSQPVRRTVALKILKPGMDSRQIVARFAAERQALALMDHPNIAHIFDAGTTGAGRPYFVMELVKGVPITKYCDDHHLTPHQRLELFIPVCKAVQHAHQKGIIHRDLKPSNVLVAKYDGRPVPKVIDFGVSKATGPKLTDQTLFTEFGAVLGTLEYMSPEQAELNQLDIDTRSDIYSLGVLLYELLTGSTPLERQRTKNASVMELLRLIREEEPPRPSTRLSTAQALPSIAASRGMEPKKLTGLLRGDLDWVVMKALEKDRNRRYETANSLATDLAHYLANEPVVARPPSRAYLVRKFVRRHRGAVVAALVLLLLLVGGIVGTTWGLFEAQFSAEQERQAKLREGDERRTAEEERAIARAVNEFLQQDLLLQADSYEQAKQGFTVDPNLTVREALHRAASRVGDRFRDRPLVEAAIREAIGKACIGVGGGIGEIALGVSQLERALELRGAALGPDHSLTLATMKSLATAYLWASRAHDALGLLEKTVKLQEKLHGLKHADTLDSMRELGVAYRAVARLQDAVHLHEETVKRATEGFGRDHSVTLGSRLELAIDYLQAGRITDAIAELEQMLTEQKSQPVDSHPRMLSTKSMLAKAYRAAGRLADAVALAEETLAQMKTSLVVDHPNTILSMHNLAGLYLDLGKYELAEPLFRETLDATRRKFGLQHARVAAVLNEFGELLILQKDYLEAETLLRESLSIRQKNEPESWFTFEAQSLLGGALMGQQRYAEAEPVMLLGYEGLKGRAPKLRPPDAEAGLREAQDRLVQLYDTWGRPDEAAKWRERLSTASEK
jgi:serine/threonine protein kinase/Tfp pilus assembly protein PilF